MGQAVHYLSLNAERGGGNSYEGGRARGDQTTPPRRLHGRKHFGCGNSIHAPMTFMFLVLVAMHVFGALVLWGILNMPYLPLPRTAVPVVAMATLVLVAWVGWGSFRDPETLWAPGDLSRYHADVARCVKLSRAVSRARQRQVHRLSLGDAVCRTFETGSGHLSSGGHRATEELFGLSHRTSGRPSTNYRQRDVQPCTASLFSAQREPAHAVPATSSVQRSAPAPPCSRTTRSHRLLAKGDGAHRRWADGQLPDVSCRRTVRGRGR